MGVDLPVAFLKAAIPNPDVVANHAAVAAITVVAMVAVVSAIRVTETNDVARFAVRLRISHSTGPAPAVLPAVELVEAARWLRNLCGAARPKRIQIPAGLHRLTFPSIAAVVRTTTTGTMELPADTVRELP